MQGERAEVGGEILQIHGGAPGKGAQLLVEPGGVGADAGGVDDEEEFFGLDLIDVKVVNRAAALIAHQGVLALAVLQFADVVGQDAVEEFRGGAAAHDDLAHVGNIEQSGGGAHGLVFIEDAGVVQGHFPAAEINQAGAQFLVGGEEWRSLKHKFPMSSWCDYIWFGLRAAIKIRAAAEEKWRMKSAFPPHPHFSTFICSLGTFRSPVTRCSVASTRALGPQA